LKEKGRRFYDDPVKTNSHKRPSAEYAKTTAITIHRAQGVFLLPVFLGDIPATAMRHKDKIFWLPLPPRIAPYWVEGTS
jgi:hypothetical protein